MALGVERGRTSDGGGGRSQESIATETTRVHGGCRLMCSHTNERIVSQSERIMIFSVFSIISAGSPLADIYWCMQGSPCFVINSGEERGGAGGRGRPK